MSGPVKPLPLDTLNLSTIKSDTYVDVGPDGSTPEVGRYYFSQKAGPDVDVQQVFTFDDEGDIEGYAINVLRDGNFVFNVIDSDLSDGPDSTAVTRASHEEGLQIASNGTPVTSLGQLPSMWEIN